MAKFIALLIAFIGSLMLAFVIDLFIAFAVEALWNGILVSAVTWAKEISYWHAFGMLLLCNFLFKSAVNTSAK